MKQLPFRDHHVQCLLQEVEKNPAPLDLTIHRYFKEHSALGSKDRAYVAETVYGFVRWRLLLDFLIPKGNWEEKRALLLSERFQEAQRDLSIEPYIRLSTPQFLYTALVQAFGEEKAEQVCSALNFPAPTTVRANLLKTTREALLEKWAGVYDVFPSTECPTAITFAKRISLFALPEFKEGAFEMQDEASQLIAGLVQAQPGDHVLDFCAGSGGKTLAIAPQMRAQGQLYLHDIRPHALLEAKKRLRRAGVQNAQFLASEHPTLNKLKKKMDWVLVDAPCSGTGTLRRNPDMKWKLSPEMIERLKGQQRTIFEKALSFVKPGGRIVYATCSILPTENEEQVNHFLDTYGVKLEGSPYKSLPLAQGDKDGFYGAVFQSPAGP